MICWIMGVYCDGLEEVPLALLILRRLAQTVGQVIIQGRLVGKVT